MGTEKLKTDAKAERLAKALRENLRRRKAQNRDRADDGEAAGDAEQQQTD